MMNLEFNPSFPHFFLVNYKVKRSEAAIIAAKKD